MASQGSVAVFQQKARHTLLEIEQDKVVVCKGDCGLPDLKVYVANLITATQSLLSKFLDFFIYSLKMQLVRMSKSQSTFKMSVCQTWRL